MTVAVEITRRIVDFTEDTTSTAQDTKMQERSIRIVPY